MTPINEVPIGKFCRFSFSCIYMLGNNFKDSYFLLPIEGFVPTQHAFNYKVYVYKRPRKEWIERAKELLESNNKGQRVDNLTYIENMHILKNYNKSDIVSED